MAQLSNEAMRVELADFVEAFGVTQRHIAKKVGLSDTTISLFLIGERDLSDEKLKIIHNLVCKFN